MEAWRVECSWWNDRGEKHGAWNARGLSLFWERLRASLHLMLTYAGGLSISECGWLRKKRVKQETQGKLTKSSALMYRPQRRLTRGMRVECAWNVRGMRVECAWWNDRGEKHGAYYIYNEMQKWGLAT